MLRSFGSSTLMCSKKGFAHLICLTNVSSEGGVLLCDLATISFTFSFVIWTNLMKNSFSLHLCLWEESSVSLVWLWVGAQGWMPKGGCPRVDAQGWVPKGGCPRVGAQGWMPNGGCPRVGPKGGYPRMDAQGWVPKGGVLHSQSVWPCWGAYDSILLELQRQLPVFACVGHFHKCWTGPAITRLHFTNYKVTTDVFPLIPAWDILLPLAQTPERWNQRLIASLPQDTGKLAATKLARF